MKPPPEQPAVWRSPADDLKATHGDSIGDGVDHCRTWVDWAATQIHECLTRDSASRDQLLAPLDDLMRTLQSFADTGQQPTIQRHMSSIVIAVQSHDRFMQQLAHIEQALRRLHEHLGDTRRFGSAESWRALREKQLQAFSMAEERVRFADILPQQEADAACSADSTEIELFFVSPHPGESSG